MYVFAPTMGKDGDKDISFGSCQSENNAPCCVLKKMPSGNIDISNNVANTEDWMKNTVFGIQKDSGYQYNDGTSIGNVGYPYKAPNSNNNVNTYKTIQILCMVIAVVCIFLLIIRAVQHRSHKHHNVTTTSIEMNEIKKPIDENTI